VSQPLRIGTRSSELALWQAKRVQSLLAAQGVKAELVHIQSRGDQNLKDPLHRIGITGVFTKALDDALLAKEIDIAVHSLKDVPTQLPEGISLPSVLERGPVHDVIVHKGETNFLAEGIPAIIATGSLRRRAQWKARFPQHTLVGLRGNVNTRLQKLVDNEWQGAIFAQAGLARIHKLPKTHLVLDWMIPAPAQGIVGVACRTDDPAAQAAITPLNHLPTQQVADLERTFMRTLEGGCTAPIGAHAYWEEGKLHFKGVVSTTDGAKQVSIEKSLDEDEIAPATLGKQWAEEVLSQGGKAIIEQIKAELEQV